MLHGWFEIREVPQTPLKVRDDRGHWLHVNAADCGSEASSFQHHHSAAHEWIEDGQLFTGCLAVIGWPELSIGGGYGGCHQGTRCHGEAACKPLMRLICWSRTCSLTLRERRDVADWQVARIEQ